MRRFTLYPLDILAIYLTCLCATLTLNMFGYGAIRTNIEAPVETQEVIEEVVPEPVEVEPVETTVYYDVPLDEDLQDYIFTLCEEREIDPRIIIAMIHKESTYNPNLVGDNGASKGLMQIQTKWHWERMEKLGVTNLFDPYQNVTVGIDYLDELIDEGNGLSWALMAYNGGPYRGWNPNNKVIKYYNTVMAYADELKTCVG